MARSLSFVPHAQTQIAELVKPPAAGESHLAIELDVGIEASGTEASNPVALNGHVRGPGDIVAVSRDMIARVEPANGLRGFEPNYMPFVEFRDADFPWRYSVELANNKDRRKPWLVLIALKSDEFEALPTASAPLARIVLDN